MKKNFFLLLAFTFLLAACGGDRPAPTPKTTTETTAPSTDDFKWQTETFADKKIIRYQVPGFDKLSLQQKKLVYYLTQAGLAGRDITYDQNYKYNLAIRHALDKIMANYKGDKSMNWGALQLYAKEVWFANGIHHHYSNDKFKPGFPQEYFTKVMGEVGAKLSKEALAAIFDPSVAPKKVDQTNQNRLVENSAVNFYSDNVSTAEATAFYKHMGDPNDPTPPLYGLNTKLVKDAKGKLVEKVWKIGGMYGPAIKEVAGWIEKAAGVAENKAQGDALRLLVEYYKTGDLRKFDEYSIAWASATAGDVDYINGFIEVYNDPLGYKGSFETIVEINDFEASDRMKVVAESAQYFEDNSPIMDQHKKKNVVGVSYKVVNVAGEAGDASPSTPIGVNLPNSNWIRAQHGSKSVSLGNIVEAYDKASGGGVLKEFANDKEEIERVEKYGGIADKMHTALHEVIGHASGQIEPGVGSPAKTIKNFASALEEARADLVALYYLMDNKLVDMGLLESLDAGKASYDDYLRNGLLTQLRRIDPGKDIEEAHMRNRAMISWWVLDKGRKDGVVEMAKRDGKTYVDIKDYKKLQQLFGELLREVQRIKSQGDYAAAKALFEKYGIKVDPELHKEVLARAEKLHIPPYGGFINPKLVPVMEGGKITDVKVEYPDDFTQQMLEYGREYGFLGESN
ncbi:MAG TPA: dihydrofolate reductase [Bacteroidetes bacterium]|nr:dihydrofolate reductase [Bacteroidota bacterium]